MYPSTINAYANFTWNEFGFPAAILQPPFFDPNADPAINYGGIGAVIGHEVSHHFDDQGSKYNERGALEEWWTPGDVQRFEALTKRLVEQYNGYERSEEHTSELQSLMRISYAVFCLKKNTTSSSSVVYSLMITSCKWKN